jgi:hypothetical protein
MKDLAGKPACPLPLLGMGSQLALNELPNRGAEVFVLPPEWWNGAPGTFGSGARFFGEGRRRQLRSSAFCTAPIAP